MATVLRKDPQALKKQKSMHTQKLGNSFTTNPTGSTCDEDMKSFES